MFPGLKQNLDGYKFEDDRDMETAVVWSLVTAVMVGSQRGIEMLVPMYDKYFSSSGNYVANEWDSKTFKSDWFVLDIKSKDPEIQALWIYFMIRLLYINLFVACNAGVTLHKWPILWR